MSNYPADVNDSDAAFDLPSVGDDEDESGGREPIPCSVCGELTSYDPTYKDLCYKCCRCPNN